MDPRYPTGPVTFVPAPTSTHRTEWIAAIGAFPAELQEAVRSLPVGSLDRPYREGGWTARQVVHHVADSHINAYCRTRLLLTEENPVVRAYDQDAWAQLPDARTADPAVSLALITALHARWHQLLLSLDPAAFTRPGQHPENGPITLDWLLQIYAWHGRHHIGHLRLLSS